MSRRPLLVRGSAAALLFTDLPELGPYAVLARAVDHRFYRAQYDAELVAGEFASHLRDAVGARSLADDWAAVVSQPLRPTSIAVWVKDTGS